MFARLPHFAQRSCKPSRPRSSFRPTLEALEDRTVPALTTAYSTSDTFLSMSEAFVGEGRIGSAAKPQGNFTFELDISKQTSGPFAPGQTADYAWSETQAEPFTLTYTPITRTAVLTMNRTGQSVTYRNVSWVDTLDDAIVVRVASYKPGASLNIEGLQLTTPSEGTQSIDSGVSAAGGAGKELLILRGVDLQEGFTLQGVSWWQFENSGPNMPKNSQLAFQVKVGEWLAQGAKNEVAIASETMATKLNEFATVPIDKKGTIRTAEQALQRSREFAQQFGYNYDDPQSRAAFEKVSAAVNVRLANKDGKQVIQAGFLNLLRFSMTKPDPTHSIFQVVKGKLTETNQAGKEVTQEFSFIEGWAVDKTGRALVTDGHGFPFRELDPALVKSFRFEADLEVGSGLFQKKPVTGERGDEGLSFKNVYDRWNNGNPNDIDWDGPTRKYKVVIQINSDGTWIFEDGSTNLKGKGKFNEVQK